MKKKIYIKKIEDNDTKLLRVMTARAGAEYLGIGYGHFRNNISKKFRKVYISGYSNPLYLRKDLKKYKDKKKEEK